MTRLLGVVALFGVGLACSDPAAPPAFGSSGSTDPTTDPSAADSTTVGGSSSTGTPPMPVVLLDGTFDLEVRDRIDVEVVQAGADVAITIDASEALGVLPTSPIEGVGRVDAYPEAAATVYTATFAVPAVADGPCGDSPITLGLALYATTGSDDVAPSVVVAGGITAYCGEDVTSGVPALEPLRVFGRRTI